MSGKAKLSVICLTVHQSLMFVHHRRCKKYLRSIGPYCVHHSNDIFHNHRCRPIQLFHCAFSNANPARSNATNIRPFTDGRDLDDHSVLYSPRSIDG